MPQAFRRGTEDGRQDINLKKMKRTPRDNTNLYYSTIPTYVVGLLLETKDLKNNSEYENRKTRKKGGLLYNLVPTAQMGYNSLFWIKYPIFWV